jgi:hypothetical protein
MSETETRAWAYQLLGHYLATSDAPDGAEFAVPRNGGLDQLLCRWAFYGQDVAKPLLDAMFYLDLSAARPPVDPAAWEAAAASRVHPLRGLRQRLNAYLHVLWSVGRVPPVTEADDTIPSQVRPNPGHTPQTSPHVNVSGRLDRLIRTLGRREPPDAPTEKDTPLPARRSLCLEAGPLLTGDTLEEPIPGLSRRIKHPSVLEERLAEEISRAARQELELCLLTVSLLDATAHPGVGQLLGASLRDYDVLSRGGDGQYRVLLPGVGPDDCAVVVARLREKLDAAVAVGTASFPGDGTSVSQLLASAQKARARDVARQVDGTVEMDRVPASMVESISGSLSDERFATVWFNGLPRRMSVQVLMTMNGVRLKLPLSFLRKGARFRLDADLGQPFRGIVREAMVSKYRAADESPLIYLDVAGD